MNFLELLLLEIGEDVKHKYALGTGAFHKVYPFEKQSDKVIKVRYGYKRSEDDEDFDKEIRPLVKDDIEQFRKYPMIFPKVYKIEDRYAVIEKLDVKKAKEKLDSLSNSVYPKKHSYTLVKNIEMAIKNNNKDFFKNILNKLPNNEDKKTFIDLSKLILRALKFLKPSILIGVLDLHDEQLGYDKEGNLKLLDY